MKNGCWICALVLCFGGWTSTLLGQEAPATAPSKPATSPAPGDAFATTPGAPGSASTSGISSALFGFGGESCYGTGNPSAQSSRYYVSAEYLLWWVKQDNVPVLSSTSTNPFDNGELGKPTTEVLFGGDIDGGVASGVRLTAGFWLDDTCKQEGFEIRGFYLAPETTNFNANSSEFPTLARPFFNVNQGIEFAEISAFPGRFTGSQSIESNSNIFGGEANALCNICCGCDYRVDLFGGVRFVELEESITLGESFQGLPAAPAPYTNTKFVSTDFFSTQNQFYGGQVGLSGDYNIGAFSIEARTQVALGDTHQSILIDGDQVVTPLGGATTVVKGDLYALPSNIGHYERDRFSVIPEVELNVGYLITSHVRAFVGYDVFYWNNVVRPGEQIDRNLDITQIPNFTVPGVVSAGKNQPSAPRDSTDFFAQGFTFGFEIRY
jgi:hypothetical protein